MPQCPIAGDANVCVCGVVVEEEWQGVGWNSVQRLSAADSVSTTARCNRVDIQTGRIEGPVQNVSQCELRLCSMPAA